MRKCSLFLLLLLAPLGCLSSSDDLDAVVIQLAKTSYEDGEPVELVIKNVSMEGVLVLGYIERQIENGKWLTVPTKNKAMYRFVIERGHSITLSWVFWDDSFTLSKEVGTGTYRHYFKLRNVANSEEMGEAHSKPYVVNRRASIDQ